MHATKLSVTDIISDCVNRGTANQGFFGRMYRFIAAISTFEKYNLKTQYV
jgi:hypothetical protein